MNEDVSEEVSAGDLALYFTSLVYLAASMRPEGKDGGTG